MPDPASAKPQVRKDPTAPYWLVTIPDHGRVAFKTWRYAITIALSQYDQEAAWRWYWAVADA